MWKSVLATANKGYSLLRFAEAMGITKDEIMVCGDTMNDRTMFAAAGFGRGYGKC